MAHKHRSMFWPFSVVILCLMMIGMILSTPTGMPYAASLQQNAETMTAYVFATGTANAQKLTATAAYPLTLTARALGDTPPSTNTPVNTNTNTPTNSPTHSPTTSVGATSADTPTVEPTNTPSPTTVPTPVPTVPAPTPTATPTQEPTKSVLDCNPGVVEKITHQTGLKAPPTTSLVILFGRPNILVGRPDIAKRDSLNKDNFTYSYSPVGGGISDTNGKYTLYLKMGNEPKKIHNLPVTYYVQIRVRDTLELLQELECIHKDQITPTLEGTAQVGISVRVTDALHS